MGGAHGLLHFLLQPQWEPAVGAGLPVPPPTGQSENHSRRAPKSGRHMGVNKVIFFFYVVVEGFNKWQTVDLIQFLHRCTVKTEDHMLSQTHRDPPDSSLPLTSLSWFLCPATSLFWFTLTAFISISVDRKGKKKTHTSSEYNYLVSTKEQPERI